MLPILGCVQIFLGTYRGTVGTSIRKTAPHKRGYKHDQCRRGDFFRVPSNVAMSVWIVPTLVPPSVEYVVLQVCPAIFDLSKNDAPGCCVPFICKGSFSAVVLRVHSQSLPNRPQAPCVQKREKNRYGFYTVFVATNRPQQPQRIP